MLRRRRVAEFAKFSITPGSTPRPPVLASPLRADPECERSLGVTGIGLKASSRNDIWKELCAAVLTGGDCKLPRLPSGSTTLEACCTSGTSVMVTRVLRDFCFALPLPFLTPPGADAVERIEAVDRPDAPDITDDIEASRSVEPLRWRW